MACSPTSVSDKNLYRTIPPFRFSLLLCSILCIKFTDPSCQVPSFAKISCYYDRGNRPISNYNGIINYWKTCVTGTVDKHRHTQERTEDYVVRSLHNILNFEYCLNNISWFLCLLSFASVYDIFPSLACAYFTMCKHVNT